MQKDLTLPEQEQKPATTPLLHTHGGGITKACLQAGVDPAAAVDLSVNISWLGLPEIVIANWEGLLPSLSPYPSIQGEGIATFYEQKFGWKQEWVLPLNGSIEGIYLFSRILKIQKILIPIPSFFDYQAAQHTTGVKTITLDLMQSDAMVKKDLLQKLPLVDGVILATPNNPTGKVFPPQLILELAAQFPKINFLVDLAFWQYTGRKESLLQQFDLPKNLFLLHSITKFYALAGIRIGAMIAKPQSLAPFLQSLPPWRINGIADKIAPLLVEAKDYEEEVTKTVCAERKKIFHALQGHPTLELLPSESNFFLAKWKGELQGKLKGKLKGGMDQFLAEALQAGFFLRDARNFTGLEGDWFRFAIHKPEVNERWVQFLLGYPKPESPRRRESSEGK